jgi:hypothetical protein
VRLVECDQAPLAGLFRKFDGCRPELERKQAIIRIGRPATLQVPQDQRARLPPHSLRELRCQLFGHSSS